MIIVAEYHPQELDQKWQAHWAATQAFEVTEDPSKPKFYCLEMFAYPSGHAHVGHVRNYIIGDVVARLKRLQGFNVLHPFGWDAFGLPAENAAIKSGIHPETSTLGNIAHMKGPVAAPGDQLRLGPRAGHLPARLLPLEPVAVHAHVRAGPGISAPLDGELVPRRQHRAGQRAGDRRRVLALRHRGRFRRIWSSGSSRSRITPTICCRRPKACRSGRRKS